MIRWLVRRLLGVAGVRALLIRWALVLGFRLLAAIWRRLRVIWGADPPVARISPDFPDGRAIS